MAITTNWSIEKLEAAGDDNVVYNVHINLTATDGTKTYTKSFVVGFALDESSTFIPYDNLTEEIVLNWVTSKLGDDVTKFEKEVKTILTNTQSTHQLKTPNLPWV